MPDGTLELADRLRGVVPGSDYLPGHGRHVMGADRVRQALTDTADLLDALADRALALTDRALGRWAAREAQDDPDEQAGD